jgi:hypothetical protein
MSRFLYSCGRFYRRVGKLMEKQVLVLQNHFLVIALSPAPKNVDLRIQIGIGLFKHQVATKVRSDFWLQRSGICRAKALGFSN